MSPQREIIRTDFDTAMDIYLDGMASGLCSALATWAPSLPEPVRDSMAADLLENLKADPLVMDGLRDEVMKRIRGIVTDEPWNATVFGGERR
ncbi:hypothetical protein C5E45_32810 [Nocardia nova]|uniref:Uncharacterized protein n=2 Tax=Nocardia nova TaxID=37330 RepID=A0A2S6ACQ9_9NOCA|nr:hypothetical protein C5E45_32810 [Nocardia nova]